MLISRRDPLTGETNTLEIDVTQDQLDSYASGTLIQDAMPNLTDDEREFIMTGLTPESWDILMAEDEGDDSTNS